MLRSVVSRGVTSLVLLFCFALPSEAQGTGGPAAGQAPAKVRMGVPKPSPQQLPGSSVLPAGADASSGSYPEGKSGTSGDSDAQSRSSEVVVAPIPFSNEAFSFGLIPVVQYVFYPDPNDKESPPSSLVAAGMLATGGSWFAGGGTSLYLKKDRYRFTGYGGYGSVGYDIFGVGTDDGDEGLAVPIRQEGQLALLELLVRSRRGKVHIGPRLSYRSFSARLNSDMGTPLPPGLNSDDLGSEVAAWAPGIKVLKDTRSDVFYPTSGYKLEFVADFFNATRRSAIVGEEGFSYQNYQLSYNYYLAMTPTQVMAFRGMVCDVEGDPPFYELCTFGSFSDIRGYQPGRYRDHTMFAVQSEYRKVLGQYFGFVLFAGVGEVAPAWDSFTWANVLPAAGTGIRFNVSRKQRINMRADIAYGENGWSWNFSIGEAF
jgi:Omp85 superfamily domain